MPITPLPAVPTRADKANFVVRADPFMLALGVLGDEAIALEASLAGMDSTATSAGTLTLTASSDYAQVLTGTLAHSVNMPLTTTLSVGRSWRIINNSTGLVTVKTSAGTTILVLAADTSVMITCVLASGTTAASWDANYSGAKVASGGKLATTGAFVATFAVPAALTWTLPNLTGTLATTGTLTQTFSGTTTFSAASLTWGSSTATGTIGVATGATLSGSTKTVNIGSTGVSGSTTNITLGSAVAGALGTITANQPLIAAQLRRGAVVTETASFTLTDLENWVICAGAASVVVTLPAASSCVGREVMFKNRTAFTLASASANVCPLTSATPGTAILPATIGAHCTLVSDGTNWVVMAAG